MDTKVENNYGQEQIQVLEGLEPVRVRPGMYIGSTDERGLHHLVYEIVDNSIDEALSGYCDTISVTINKDGSVTVVDNGRGIPTGIKEKEGISAVELVLTKLHAGGKFGSGGYKISGGLHGVGLSVVNALSNTLYVEVRQNGHLYAQTYHKGIPDDRLKIIGEADTTGTSVTFYPDDTIFETVNFKYATLRHRLRELAFLNKGLSISFTDNRPDTPLHDDFRYDGGIIEFVDDLTQMHEKLFPETLYFRDDIENGEIEFSMQYTDTYNEVIFAFANNINTEEGGTHLDGFKTSLTRVINAYGKKVGLLKENDGLTGDDVREGIVCVISVKITNPQFEGQTKTKLGNSEIRGAMSKESKDLIMRSLNAQKAREAARKAREEARRKSPLDGASLPGKLADCSEKDSS